MLIGRGFDFGSGGGGGDEDFFSQGGGGGGAFPFGGAQQGFGGPGFSFKVFRK